MGVGAGFLVKTGRIWVKSIHKASEVHGRFQTVGDTWPSPQSEICLSSFLSVSCSHSFSNFSNSWQPIIHFLLYRFAYIQNQSNKNPLCVAILTQHGIFKVHPQYNTSQHFLLPDNASVCGYSVFCLSAHHLKYSSILSFCPLFFKRAAQFYFQRTICFSLHPCQHLLLSGWSKPFSWFQRRIS